MKRSLWLLFLFTGMLAGIGGCVSAPAHPRETTQPGSELAGQTQIAIAQSTPTAIPSATSTPLPLPAFEGRLVIFERGLSTSICGIEDYEEYYAEEIGHLAVIQEIEQGVIERTNLTSEPVMSPVISPNGKYVLVVLPCPPFRIQYIDLQTREITTVTTFPYKSDDDLYDYPTCLSWSPDGNQFSYMIENTLYAQHLITNEVSTIYSAPSALYEKHGRLYGDLSCVDWVGNDHLLFQRFAGEMPYIIVHTSQGFSALQANTTALASLSPSIQLVDMPERLRIVAKANDLSGFMILRGSDQEVEEHAFVRPFANLEEMEMVAMPIKLATPQDRIHFVLLPRSSGLVALKEDAATYKNTLLRFSKEMRLEQEISFPEAWLLSWVEWWKRHIQGRDADYSENASLPFGLSPTDRHLLIFQSDACMDGAYRNCEFRIGDLESGIYRPLWQGPQDQVDILAWLP